MQKELIDKGICDEGVIWNPSNCEWNCDKSCDVWEYLDYANCKCRKRLTDKLVEECSENINEKILHSNEINIMKKYVVLVVYTLYCWSYFSH